VNRKLALYITPVIAVLSVLIIFYVQPALCCYGPQITATISKTEVNINETVTVTGQICPVEPNRELRLCFVRPDLTWVDMYFVADNKTGEFSISQELDMAGYWNIFPINSHMSDRLYAEVTNPSDDSPNPASYTLPPFKPNVKLFAIAGSLVSIGAVVALWGRRNRTKKISSLRLFVQVALVFIIFFGMFVDHQYLARPLRQIAVHEFIVGDNVLGVSMPDGLPAPFYACYYPCGKTVTCAL
jgi:hypothetical protein